MNPALGQRQPLPSRRRSEARRIEWLSPVNPDGWPQTIYITIGYDEDALTPREVFYDAGYKSGSDMETLLRDLCIVLSILLQYDGVDLGRFMSSISREVRANPRNIKSEMGAKSRSPEGRGREFDRNKTWNCSNIRTDQAEMGSLVGVLLQELRTPPQWAGELETTATKSGEGGPL